MKNISEINTKSLILTCISFKTNILIIISLLIFGIVSCKDEDEDKSKDITLDETQTWIEKTMRENYLWNTEIPSREKLNGSLSPEDFFFSLLSSNDGKHTADKSYYYSYIEEKEILRSAINGKNSYGFDFVLYQTGRSDYPYFARVIYVLPGSPAEEARLKRGDWVISTGGKSIKDDYNILMQGSGGVFQITKYDNVNDSFTYPTTLQMPASRTVENNPVFFQKILETGGKKIGYLVYNEFQTGPGGPDDHLYDESLQAAFSGFKQQNINELILDLRYNSGGYVTCAQLLASLIVPPGNLNSLFCYMDFNGRYTRENMKFLPSASTANLNLNRVYVLVSNFTASSFELVINGLKPYMDVILIGTQTEGKNVGSAEFTDDKFNWTLHPIVSRVYNSKGFTDYANGFAPDYEIDELESLTDMLPLGDAGELVLNKALSVITGTKSQLRSTGKTLPVDMKIAGSSLDNKKMKPGMILDFMGK